MNKFEKIASIFVIIVATLAILSFIYLCFVGEFQTRWIITMLFCIFLIVTNVIDIRNRWK